MWSGSASSKWHCRMPHSNTFQMQSLCILTCVCSMV
jgi:hypothetical protein